MQKIGKYDLLEKIGAGGFGEVFKGRDPLIKRLVAIKTCNSNDPLIRERFFKEAEIAGNLHHRNITTVYDFGLEDELPFLVQEYLSGEDLNRKIKRGDFLPYPEKLFYLLQIARGLAYAHSQGVIHRDVKPGNVRILEDGTAKILDFGIAKLAQQETGLTQTGMTLGTAAYLAPEQIRGDPADHRTDVFAFGILAYELLTYERPFPGQQISVVIHQILDHQPRPLIEKWPAAPAAIVAVIERCLDKDPARRFAHGAELLRALENVQKTGRAERRSLDDEPTAELGGSPPPPRGAERPPPDAARPSRSSRTPEPSPAAPLEDAGFEASGAGVRTSGERAPHGSPGWRLPVALLLASVAVGGGWWLGKRGGGSPGPSEAAASGNPPATAALSAGGDQAGPATVSGLGGDGAAENDGLEEAAAAGSATDGVGTADEAVAEPPPRASVEPAPPPPAPPPATLVLEPPGWTDAMTAEVAGKTYGLTRRWSVELPPGPREVTFALRMDGFSRRQTLSVDLAAGDQKIVAAPIAEPGAVSVRPFPSRPRGEVWLDGELLGTTPVGARVDPGPHRIEIRPVDGNQQPAEWQGAIQSGQETVLSFDLGSGRVSEGTKPLSP